MHVFGYTTPIGAVFQSPGGKRPYSDQAPYSANVLCNRKQVFPRLTENGITLAAALMFILVSSNRRRDASADEAIHVRALTGALTWLLSETGCDRSRNH